ncbi:MAG: hypothetical protein ACRD1Y_02230, partial [Terriglobales bacterium]
MGNSGAHRRDPLKSSFPVYVLAQPSSQRGPIPEAAIHIRTGEAAPVSRTKLKLPPDRETSEFLYNGSQ